MDNRKDGKYIQKGLLVFFCILVNLAGKVLAHSLHLPIWLDMVGTCIAIYVAGLPGGIIAGVSLNLLYGVVDSASIPYALTGLVAAFGIWFCVKKGYLEEPAKAIITSIIIGFICVLVSTPINLILFDGYSGNIWGDALFDMLLWRGFPKGMAAILDEMLVEIVDKQVCILLAALVIGFIKRRGSNGDKKVNRKRGTRVGALFLPVLLALSSVSLPAQAKSSRDLTEGNYIPQIYNNRSGMMSSEANTIGETGDGFIWIGSYAGLTRYDGREFSFIRDGGIAGVNSMMTDHQGRLWIGTNDGGIARYEDGRFHGRRDALQFRQSLCPKGRRQGLRGYNRQAVRV